MRRTMTTLAFMVACSGSALAGPLLPERVLPDATWVLHVDIESMVNSTFGRAVLDGSMGAEIRAEITEEAMQEMGIDPLRDLRGLTIFGHTEEETEAVILISATNAIDAPLAKLPDIVPNYSAIREGDRVVHSWRDDDETVYAYAAPGRDAGERLVLFSGNVDELRRGILRLEMGGADLAPALKGRAPTPGSFVFFSADQIPGLADGNDMSALLRFARGIVFDAGEQGNELHADARVTTSGQEDANTMLQVVQGMMALGRIAASSEPDIQPLLKIADGCRASTDGADLLVTLRLDLATITQAIREMDEHERADDQDDAKEDEAKIRESLKSVEKIEKTSPRKKVD
ncbi:MAG: hypothetical protein JNK58_06890 [Phycisphaerae bacterium]|nr:hypothetical protein [Phycisphaerae bacterium]